MSSTTLQRLLRYPHPAVFDKDPVSELVIRLRHADGCTWRIASGAMTATAGAAEFTYDLTTLTVAQLIDALQDDGFELLNLNARFHQLSALVLVEGEGDQGLSNGDHIYGFTSLLWALFSGYSREVDAAAEQVRQALLQMVIATASNEWLDLWGTLYAAPRATGETDAAYRLRIPREAFRIRVNPRAIELAIKDLTGKDVTILEPWRDVFTLDQSELSGPDKMQDGELVGPFLIQPQSVGSIDWSDVLPIVERNRPAGVLMLPPQVLYVGGAELTDPVTVGTSISRRHATAVQLEDLALLDYADIEETSELNHPLIYRRSVQHLSGVRYYSRPWPALKWENIAWSEANVSVGTSYTRLGPGLPALLDFSQVGRSQYLPLIT